MKIQTDWLTVEEMTKFLENVQLSTSKEIAVPHEPALDWRKGVTTFEEHLERHYGPVGTERRDEYERGLKNFMESIPLPETEQ